MQVRNVPLLALLLFSCTNKPEKNTVTSVAPTKFCMEQDCLDLEDSGYECFENKKSDYCPKFTATFEKLLNPYLCDGKINPHLNINNCGNRPGATYVDLHFKRLSQLDDPKAIALYSSEKFRKVLDGNIAEEHYSNSLKQEMILNPKLLPKGYKAECIEYERKLNSKPVIADIMKYKKAEFDLYQINDYQVSLGQFGLHVASNNQKCHTKIEGEVRSESLQKFKQFDVVKIQSYGFEKMIETIVDLKTCKILWVAELLHESLEMNSAPQNIAVKKSGPSQGAFKTCDSCWNKSTRECKSY